MDNIERKLHSVDKAFVPKSVIGFGYAEEQKCLHHVLIQV